MSLEVMQKYLMWSALINYGLLIFWFVWYAFAYSSYVRLNEFVIGRKIEHLDAMTYAGMVFYKLMVIIFNIIPWVVINCVK